jgi:hypothetical protein
MRPRIGADDQETEAMRKPSGVSRDRESTDHPRGRPSYGMGGDVIATIDAQDTTDLVQIVPSRTHIQQKETNECHAN